MWDSNKQARWNVLHEREISDVLSEAEQVELSRLTDEIEQEEQIMLQPGFTRLDKEIQRLTQECIQTKKENVTLASLLAQREHLLECAKKQIKQLLEEHWQLKLKTEHIKPPVSLDAP